MARSQTYNFRHLQAFAAVARAGGVRLAASEVNLSQPAISQAVLKIEGHLGERLFLRSAGESLHLTESGKLFADRVERSIAYLSCGEQEFLQDGSRIKRRPQIARHATRTQLKSFLEVIAHGGYTLAARWLGVSQPSVHRAVRELEALCGQKLFAASAYGVQPTAQALALARWIGLAFREVEQGVEELSERRGLRNGTISVGSLPLARAQLLPAAVTKLLKVYPDARVKILDGSYADLLSALHRGEIDSILGALRAPLPSKDVVQEALFQEPLSVVVRAGHPILKKKRLNDDDMSKLEWVAPNERTPARTQFNAYFTSRGIDTPGRIIECSSFVAVRSLVLQSNRAGLVSISQASHELMTGKLKVASFNLAGTERAIGILTRRQWHPTGLQNAFLDLLREESKTQCADNRKFV